MGIGAAIAGFSVKRPKLVTFIMVQVTLLVALLAALPTLWPDTFSSLNSLKVDTDPENMLPEDEDVRVFHDSMKKEMSLYDMLVVGVVNEEHPAGVFNPETLGRIEKLTAYAGELRGGKLLGLTLAPDDPRRAEGVIPIDMISPSTVDNVYNDNGIRYEWLMRKAPATQEEADAIREKARRIPFLNGTLVSEDGKAVALYLPLTSKHLSYKVSEKLRAKIAELGGSEEYHITGLPVAEDTFGVEMFKQMAISAPIAMLVIFLLMLLFFRKLTLIVSPMIVAIVCVITTMGLLVISGNTVHIMSSMIPIFIMPIAVLDAVHILSDFFDRYQQTRDRAATIIHVMDTLFWPMLYTSITTAVGFASLALTPIPPVQVFGIFIALGVALAWVWTLTFVPAFVMFVSEKSLQNFGSSHHEKEPSEHSALSRLMAQTGRLTYRRAKTVMACVLVASLIAAWGISLVRINDNPIKWFVRSHPIRKADDVLNAHFGGTYMGYLALETEMPDQTPQQYGRDLVQRLSRRAQEADAPALKAAFAEIQGEVEKLGANAESEKKLLTAIDTYAADRQFEQETDDGYDAWDEALSFIATESLRDQAFKRPDVLAYVRNLQEALLEIRRDGETGAGHEARLVGKSNSVADIVQTVRREYISGESQDYRIPASAAESAQLLLSFQQSNRPQDLWHFITPDYRKAVVWVQLRSGNNRDMKRVVDAVDAFIQATPAPAGVELSHRWFGLTYINVIWQQKMVAGMLRAFLGSFLIVFLLMTILYRSALWGLLSMVPLTVTIAMIYGAIGIAGKDYDMPVAVLSSLSLGLAIDYAIHFLSRSRQIYQQKGSWRESVGAVFGEPARAIARNVVVIGVGFLPLIAAPLMPYKTVGMFIAAILLTAGLASLLILPSLMRLLEPYLFPRTKKCCLMCNCVTCIVSAVAVVAIIAINVAEFVNVGWTSLTWISIVAVIVLAQACYFIGKSKRCRMQLPLTEGDEQ